MNASTNDIQTEEERIRAILQPHIEPVNTPTDNESSLHRVDWPTEGNVLSDYRTMFLQSMAFPSLFPYGFGDVRNGDKCAEITYGESNPHLLKYPYYDNREGTWI